MDTQHRTNGQGGDPYGGPQDARWELLSAYVDGEVTDAERATVEAWLQEDAAARDMLGELQRLSVTLRSLSAGIPSPDLREATLQYITRVQPVSSAETRSQSWFPRWRRREFLAAALGAAASLAVMLIVPWSPQTQLDTLSRWGGNGVVVSHATGSALAMREDGGQEWFVDSRDAVPEASMMVSSSMPRGNPSPLTRKTLAVAQDAALLPSTAAMAGSMTAVEVALSAEEQRSLESWDEIQPYLGLLSQNTTAVANFDLVVLDVKQAADQFEVLLIQNGIPVVIEGTHGPDAERSLAQAKAQPGVKKESPLSESAAEEPSLSAVYVEADGEPITRALQELVRRRQVLSVKLQPPLQFDAVPQLADADGVEEQLQRTLELKRAYQNRSVVLADRNDLNSSVSAQDQLENRLSREVLSNASNMPAEKAGTATLNIEMRAGRSPATAATPLRRGTDELQKVDGARAQTAGGRPGAESDAGLVGHFGQRLNLPQPKVNWLEEVQQDMVRQRSADDKAFQNQLAESERSEINRLRFLQQNYQRSASGAVRVLFVMHPADAESEPVPASPR